jgi:phage shock protein C
MTSATRTNIFFGRPDTILGICEAVGRDLGFSPNLLRLALGMTLLFQPVLVIGTYLGLGVLVFVTRTLFPVPRVSVPAETTVLTAQNDAHAPDFALAA